MENIRKEVAAQYPEGIFSRSSAIYRDILNQDLKAGQDLTIRFDWCNKNQFVVNYMVSDLRVEDYKNYRKLLKDEFVEKLMKETNAFKMGTQNSLLDIHFAIGENHDLYYMYSDVKTPTNKVMASHNKNCKEGFLVYTPSQHGIVKDLPPTNNDSIGANVNTEKGDIDVPETKLPEKKETLDKSKEEAMNSASATGSIIRHIDSVIADLEKLKVLDKNKENISVIGKQFEKVSNNYEAMIIYIEDIYIYITSELIKEETDFNKNAVLQEKYAKFITVWNKHYKVSLNNQYKSLDDTLSRLNYNKINSYADGFIYMLKEFRNYINVNLFGKPAALGVLGGKTKRRYRTPFQGASVPCSLKNRRIAKKGFANVERRKKTIRKRMAKQQTKKFRRNRLV